MILKHLKKSLFINLSLTLLIFLLDRISKIYVIYLNDKFLGSEIFSSKFLNIILVWNEGIAFGFFSFDDKILYNLLTIIIFIIIFIIGFMIVNSTKLKKYALIMIFAGALGNLYDRIVFKAVPDFIDFHIQGFHWFIFNFADIFITSGVFFMILLEFIGNNKNKIEDEKY
tara:strand:+ start:621 stop:1130 length:510 start_codon:yes stop_codon:yes gene_type:complete